MHTGLNKDYNHSKYRRDFEILPRYFPYNGHHIHFSLSSDAKLSFIIFSFILPSVTFPSKNDNEQVPVLISYAISGGFSILQY